MQGKLESLMQLMEQRFTKVPVEFKRKVQKINSLERAGRNSWLQCSPPSPPRGFTGSTERLPRGLESGITHDILPAIDLRNGKCVRLRQGDYAQETIFGDDPVEMARRWVSDGAAWLAPCRS